MGATIVRRDLSSQVRGVQLGVGVGGVPVPTPPGAEHHVTSVDGALVHFAEMYRRKVYFEGTFITERLEADVALHALLASGGTNVGHANVVAHLLPDL